jgi:putative nucleotidyltransferase with HDIG domain
LVLSDASKDSRFENFGFVNTKGWMGVPLIEQGEVFGILTVDSKSPGAYNDWDAKLIQIFANNAAAVIAKSRLFENLQKINEELTQSYDSTIEGWARTMELRDQETQGHSERVTEMTLKLARALGMSKEELIHVRRGAVLHDVGKIGIPDSILQKPGKLNEEEWEIMRQHPTLAYNVLSSSNFLKKALDIPYCHHEKWDGSGYPRALKGDDIPLTARAFAIVDVYDALRSDRPYREAWSQEKTLIYITEQSGTHFDPEVVDTFLELITEDPEFDLYEEKGNQTELPHKI